MKQKYYLPGICLAVFGLMASGCSSEDPDMEVPGKNGNQMSEVNKRQEGQKEEEDWPDGKWAPIDWEVRSTSNNPIVSFKQANEVWYHEIILTAPGGSLEMVAVNYEWPGLTTIDLDGGFPGNEYEEGRVRGITGKNYNIHSLGNVLTCEFFDIPGDFSGELVAFTVSAGDRFESFRVSVASAK